MKEQIWLPNVKYLWIAVKNFIGICKKNMTAKQGIHKGS